MKLLHFSANWCEPCKRMQPILDDLGETYDIEKINVDENPTKSTEFRVRAVPTFVVLVDNKEVDRLTGTVSKDKLREVLEKYALFDEAL